MNRRPLLILVLAVGGLAGGGLIALGVGRSGTGASPSSAASGSPGAVAPGAGSPSVPAPSLVAPSSAAPLTPAPSCGQQAQRVAVRAAAADTGFPVAVRWTDLGPVGDLFFTLSDVSPTIFLAPPGPSSLNVGLSYATGGDHFAFTAGSLTLAYDSATGRLSGRMATGYGKNSNRATKDSQPSAFEGVLIRPDAAGANGLLTGRIMHPASGRTFEFRVVMIEKIITIASGPGCASARPTDASLTP